MSPQEFRLMRTAMGISRADIARELKVSKDTVHKWDMDKPAPEAVQEWLHDKWELFLTRINETMDMIEDNPGVPLILYRGDKEATARQHMSAAQHRQLMSAIYLVAQLENVPVTFMDAPSNED